MEVDFARFTRGKGFWKFNSSLLSDSTYRDLVKSTIKRVTAQYAVIDGNQNFYETATKEELNKFYDTAMPDSLQ